MITGKMYGYISDNQNTLKSSWERFIYDGIIDDNVPPLIAQSWNLDKQLNVDPFISSCPVVYNETDREKNRLLNIAVEDTLKDVSLFLETSSSAIGFFDSKSIITAQYGDSQLIDKFQSIDMIPGRSVDQQSMGTNPVNLALKHKKPFFIGGAFHFAQIFHDYGSFSVPIFNKRTNEVFGVLDLSAPIKSFNKHTFAFVHSCASSIERAVENNYLRKEYHLINYYNERYYSSQCSIIVINTDKKIIHLNEKASSLFRGTLNWIGHHISALSITKLMNYIPIDEKEVEFYDTLANEIDVRIVLKTISHDKEIIGWIVQIFPLENTLYKDVQNKGITFNDLIGKSRAFQSAIHKAKKFACSKANVLILGESGTGKEKFACALHDYSDRRNGPFITVNCGAIPKELISSELFGYEEGAFSGAKKGGAKGKFELAHGGTIFLDEIGELPLDQQVYLLRVIQERVIYRLGGNSPIPIDVRIISATNVNLEEAVRNNQFREDLFFRLNTLTLQLPSIRERGKEDIIQLVKYFSTLYGRKEGKKIEISEDTLDFLGSLDWKGNIREIENMVQRLIVLADGQVITAKEAYKMLNDIGTEENTEKEIGSMYKDDTFNDYNLEDIERAAILKALGRNNGNISKASNELNISRPTLYRKMEKYKIEKERNVYQ
ncbi:sigma 54-interacting transcriptional regulator [Bacillus sp. JJ1773]|uniref:sigma-54-dependent Fis family transcriptional regulator n=1 Tax=Bacillus sp. JJ1773 TaxID=3122965 RepID=UPI002FFDCB49